MHPDRDPYAPPPRHKEKGGAIVRFLIVTVLLGAAAWGYMTYTQSSQSADLTPPAQEQSLADAGYAVEEPASTEALPQTADEPQTPPVTTTESPAG